jgi:hypothetical protein
MNNNIITDRFSPFLIDGEYKIFLGISKDLEKRTLHPEEIFNLFAGLTYYTIFLSLCVFQSVFDSVKAYEYFMQDEKIIDSFKNLQTKYTKKDSQFAEELKTILCFCKDKIYPMPSILSNIDPLKKPDYLNIDEGWHTANGYRSEDYSAHGLI